MKAVMMPTGISSGRTASRAPTSIQIIKTAPHRADRGIRRRWSAPTTDRTRWGMTSPTKPMQPLTATAEAVSRAGGQDEHSPHPVQIHPQGDGGAVPHEHGVQGTGQGHQHQEQGRKDQCQQGQVLPFGCASPPSIQKVASRTAASSGAV